ncbi:MAG TPA: hypothetical protein VKB24_00255, partial [Candidatus Acidoferrum sp.]|nr:hypothetical protein [Candidatus Acidoferrum sp.]
MTGFPRGRIKKKSARCVPHPGAAPNLTCFGGFSMPVNAIPEGFHTITPGLTCKNAAAAIEL